MKVLIIGSKGFIGSHCLEYFTKKGHIVVGCDIVGLLHENNYFKLDPENPDYKTVFKEYDFDFCINCSGAANVQESFIYPNRDFCLNIHSVQRILEALREYCQECKFLNISSAAVYGNPEFLPITESHKLNPISPYGYNKLIAELLCKEYYEIFTLRTASIRIFSAYGNGLKKQIFWDLYNKFNRNISVRMFGSGYESRDFIHIDDLVNQIDLVLNNANFNGDSINSANGMQITIREIVNEFANQLKFEGEILFTNDKRTGDPKNWEADISMMKLWGYNQTVKINEGIKRYLKWAKENI